MVIDENLIFHYQKCFDDWDQSSAVRSKPNRYQFSGYNINFELEKKKWFLPAGVPILNHRFLKNISDAQEQYLLGKFLLQFLEYGTILEHEFVNTILAELALGECGIPIPNRMRLDAFKIYTDEAYHAYFNIQATQNIQNYLNIKKHDPWPLSNTRLTALRNLIPEHDTAKNFLVRLGIVFVSETIAPKELAESLNGIVIEPIYNLFIDHAEDERKHCIFFSTLFEIVWNYLSYEEKRTLGLCFPQILKSFVRANTIAIFDSLIDIGVDEKTAKIIIRETYPESFDINRAISVASITFRNFERLGLFNIQEVKEKFIHEGFTRII